MFDSLLFLYAHRALHFLHHDLAFVRSIDPDDLVDVLDDIQDINYDFDDVSHGKDKRIYPVCFRVKACIL